MLFSRFRAPWVLAAPLLLSSLILFSTSALAGKQAAPVEPSRKHTGSIVGKVVDTSGKPVAEAVVRLQDSVTQEVSTYKSGKKGEYKITNLVPGTYSLEAEANGLQSESVGVKVSNDAVTTQDLKVEPKK